MIIFIIALSMYAVEGFWTYCAAQLIGWPLAIALVLSVNWVQHMIRKGFES